MKKKTNFLKRIFNFFDRYIIMPITRLVFKITKKFSVPNKKFETWLSKQSTLLFISLFISIAVFIVVDQKILNFSNQSAEVLKDQKVNVIYHDEQYVVEGLPETVDVTLIGKKADLYIAKQSSGDNVTIDLTGLTPGTHKVKIEYKQGKSGIEYSVNPSVATVIIYDKISDTKTLSYDVVNEDKLSSTLSVNDVKLVVKSGEDDKEYKEIDEVTIRGAEYKVKQVASVKALVDVSHVSGKTTGTQIIDEVTLKAYDSDGNVVDVEFVPENVSAQVELSSPSKKVPLNFVPSGTLPTGKALSSYNFSPSNVTIYGDSESLEAITSLDVVVDISKISDDETFKVELKKPAGVKTISDNFVNISLTVTNASSEPVRFNIPLTGINLAEGLSAQPINDDNGFIVVEVQGASSVLSSINESDITAYVDLKNLTEGTYTKQVIVKGSNPLATYKAKRTEATVEITR